MTKFAKALVFVNLFIGIGLFAWAVSLYANRIAYFDVKDADPPVVGLFTKLKAEVDELSPAISTNQDGYARKSTLVAGMEQERLVRRGKLTDRLNRVRIGDDEKIVFHQWLPQQPNDPLLKISDALKMPALIDVYVEDAKVPTTKNTRDGDLQGLGYLKSQMSKGVKDETDTILRIREARKKMDELNTETDKTQAELFAQKVIRLNLLDQKDYLADVRVNWDEQLKTLVNRRDQLTRRLAEYGIPQTKTGATNDQ